MTAVKSLFAKIKPTPPIEVFHMQALFNADKSEQKVDLSVGAYRDEEGKPFILPVVTKTKLLLTIDGAVNHEYLPGVGLPKFRDLAPQLLLGPDSCAIKEGRALGIQSLSGTGALSIGAQFLANVMGRQIFYYSDPTWMNHEAVFKAGGFKEARSYPYWDKNTLSVNFEQMIHKLDQAPKDSVIILQAAGHNPTGMDPTKEQWKDIADVMETRKLFPFFDSAYQGYASGNPDKDAWPVRYFADRGFELFAAQSFSKNFGLYGERIGCLTIVQQDCDTEEAIRTQMATLVRARYSNPPAFGAHVVSKILGHKELYKEWTENLGMMAGRIKSMRACLRDQLIALKTPGKWDHITEQIGMFSFTGLNEAQSKALVEKHHIYLLKNGRINVAGLNKSNVECVASSINKVLKEAAPKAPDAPKAPSAPKPPNAPKAPDTPKGPKA